jgi:anti-sigma B factor antagonist
MPSFTAETQGAAGTCRLVVDGELDIATAPKLVDAFDRALEDRPPEIVMDLRHVEFSDSTGIAALIRCRRRAVRSHSRLVLDTGDGAVARLLAITRLGQVFDHV